MQDANLQQGLADSQLIHMYSYMEMMSTPMFSLLTCRQSIKMLILEGLQFVDASVMHAGCLPAAATGGQADVHVQLH